MNTLPHPARILMGLGIAFAVLGSADPAAARTETLEWEYSAPERIAGFEVLWGTQSGSYAHVVDVGDLGASGGVYTYGLEVPDAATVYIAVRAYDGSGVRSGASNERVRTASGGSAPPVEPPPPSPDPDPTAAAPDPFSPAGDLVIDFQSASTGTAVGGWVDTRADNSLSIDDSLFDVVDLDGNRALRTRSVETNIHSHYTAGNSDGWTSYEYRGAMLITDASGGIGVTALSGYPDQDVYYRLRRYAGTAFDLAPHGTTLSCANDSTGVVPQAGAWYRFSLRVDVGSSNNRVRAKVWRDGTSEPGSPQVDCSDTSSSRPRAGTIGVWSMGPGTKLWDVLDVDGIGSTSTPAPVPPAPPTLISVEPAGS